MIRDLAHRAARAVTSRIDAGSRANARAEIDRGRALSDRRTAPWLTVRPDVPPGTGDPPQEGAGS